VQQIVQQPSEHIVSFRSENLKEDGMSGTKDKIVAITGASSGIAERGAKVVLGARGTDRLAALAGRIVGAGGEAAYATTDVRRRDDLSALIALACERYGKRDVLVNNAGVMPISPLDDLRVEDWEEMIEVNIKGVLYGIAAALRVSHTGIRTVRQHRLYRRSQDRADDGGLFRDEVRGSHHLRGFAAGGWRSPASHHHFAWHGSDELCGGRDESDRQSPARTIP
jgi:hypothetical protein